MQDVNRTDLAAIGQWTPVAVDVEAGHVELLDLDGATYEEPFFHETVERHLRERPALRSMKVDFRAFLYASERYGNAPDAFVFHLGRCGSTLLANMLSASGDHLLIKEPPIVSDLISYWLRAATGAAQNYLELLLDGALRSLAATGREQRYRVIKFAAWNVRMAGPLLHRFPETPAVFVYRRPAEVVASLIFQPPAWFDLIDCPRTIQACFFPTIVELPVNAPLSPVSMFAHAWRSAAEAALAQSPERVLLVDYQELKTDPTAAIERVLAHLGHTVPPERMGKIAAAAAKYSKDPLGRARFDPAGLHQRPALPPEAEYEVEKIAGGVWQRLEEQRARSGNGATPCLPVH